MIRAHSALVRQLLDLRESLARCQSYLEEAEGPKAREIYVGLIAYYDAMISDLERQRACEAKNIEFEGQ